MFVNTTGADAAEQWGTETLLFAGFLLVSLDGRERPGTLLPPYSSGDTY
jgi:hypothetical protein